MYPNCEYWLRTYHTCFINFFARKVTTNTKAQKETFMDEFDFSIVSFVFWNATKSVSTQKTTKNTLCTIKKTNQKKYIEEYTTYKQTVQGMHRTIDVKRDDLVKILIWCILKKKISGEVVVTKIMMFVIFDFQNWRDMLVSEPWILHGTFVCSCISIFLLQMLCSDNPLKISTWTA